MLAALQRVAFDADQGKQRGGGGRNAVTHQLTVVGQFGAGGRKRLDDRNRHARVAAGRVDGEVGRRLECCDARAVLPPFAETGLPQFGLLPGELIDAHARAARIVRVHPRLEVFGLQIGESEEEVREVAFGIDHDGGNVVDRGFLNQADAQAGLAAAGHTDANRVRHQIFRVVQDEVFALLLVVDVVLSPEVEDAQFFKVGHDFVCSKNSARTRAVSSPKARGAR